MGAEARDKMNAATATPTSTQVARQTVARIPPMAWASVSLEVNSADKMNVAWASGVRKRKTFSEVGVHSAGTIGSGSVALVEGRSIKATVGLALVMTGRLLSIRFLLQRFIWTWCCLLGRMHDRKGQRSGN